MSGDQDKRSTPLDEFKRVSRVYAAFAGAALLFGGNFVAHLVGDFKLEPSGSTLLYASAGAILSSLLIYAIAEWNVLSLTVAGKELPSDFSYFLGLFQLLLVIVGVAIFALFTIRAFELDAVSRVPRLVAGAPTAAVSSEAGATQTVAIATALPSATNLSSASPTSSSR